MLDQITFDRSEEIAAALHEQEGVAIAMTNYIASLNLRADYEHVLFALLNAQPKGARPGRFAEDARGTELEQKCPTLAPRCRRWDETGS